MPNGIKRILAYAIDMIAISLIASSLAMSAINPNAEKILKNSGEYQEKYSELESTISELETNEEIIASEDKIEEFYDYYKYYLHEQSKLSVYDSCITVICIILYFVVFAYFFGGQTVGKRIMRIKIVDEKENPVTIFKLLVRALVLYGIPITILNTILSFILNTDSNFVAYIVLYIISFALEVTILVTTFARKDNRGIHDLIARTKVINDGKEI